MKGILSIPSPNFGAFNPVSSEDFDMSFLYRNWFIHNVVAHPLHEFVYLSLRLLMFGKCRASAVSDYIHDVTIPTGVVKYEALRQPLGESQFNGDIKDEQYW